jgi:hypothetical protein
MGTAQATFEVDRAVDRTIAHDRNCMWVVFSGYPGFLHHKTDLQDITEIYHSSHPNPLTGKGKIK